MIDMEKAFRVEIEGKAHRAAGPAWPGWRIGEKRPKHLNVLMNAKSVGPIKAEQFGFAKVDG